MCECAVPWQFVWVSSGFGVSDPGLHWTCWCCCTDLAALSLWLCVDCPSRSDDRLLFATDEEPQTETHIRIVLVQLLIIILLIKPVVLLPLLQFTNALTASITSCKSKELERAGSKAGAVISDLVQEVPDGFIIVVVLDRNAVASYGSDELGLLLQ